MKISHSFEEINNAHTFVNTDTATCRTPSNPWNESRLQSGCTKLLRLTSSVSMSCMVSVSDWLTCSICTVLCQMMFQIPLSMYRRAIGRSPYKSNNTWKQPFITYPVAGIFNFSTPNTESTICKYQSTWWQTSMSLNSNIVLSHLPDLDWTLTSNSVSRWQNTKWKMAEFTRNLRLWILHLFLYGLYI